jgi:hypothetical protein
MVNRLSYFNQFTSGVGAGSGGGAVFRGEKSGGFAGSIAAGSFVNLFVSDFTAFQGAVGGDVRTTGTIQINLPGPAGLYLMELQSFEFTASSTFGDTFNWSRTFVAAGESYIVPFTWVEPANTFGSGNRQYAVQIRNNAASPGSINTVRAAFETVEWTV